MTNYTLLPRQDESEPQNEKKPSSTVAETKPEAKSSTAVEGKAEMKSSASAASKNGGAPPLPVPIGWTVDGVPVGDPRAGRYQWGSSIFACAGEREGFHSSDVEVCVLGSVAPCVLHGSNVERLKATPDSFDSHCWPYAGLYVLGNCFFGWNCLAPWYAYPNRTAIRRRFNLEGGCETVARTLGCSANILMNEAQRERCESTCDLATHVFCHPCALCQEAREVRRQIPHPGLMANPAVVMLPPSSQTMARLP